MGARYYHPVLGRFTGVDPVGFLEESIHSHNRYAYANNNPYKYVDPDGQFPFLIPLAIYAIGALKVADTAITVIDTAQALHEGDIQTAAMTAALSVVRIPGSGVAAKVVKYADNAADTAKNTIKVTEKGLSRVEKHLSQFEFDKPTAEMLQRLRSGKTTEHDLTFYTHELKESAFMKRGFGAKEAHEKTLEWQGIPSVTGYEAKLYHRDVIKDNRTFFNQITRSAAGVE